MSTVIKRRPYTKAVAAINLSAGSLWGRLISLLFNATSKFRGASFTGQSWKASLVNNFESYSKLILFFSVKTSASQTEIGESHTSFFLLSSSSLNGVGRFELPARYHIHMWVSNRIFLVLKLLSLFQTEG